MRLVLAHGCFDILHIGHVMHLEAAKELGDRLIVTISLDEHIKKPGRPVFNHHLRKHMLLSLRAVDEVYLSPHEGAAWSIIHFKPSIYVKGCDYKSSGLSRDEYGACKKVGAEIIYTETPKYASSDYVEFFR